MAEKNISKKQAVQGITAEILELGEMLFDTIIEIASQQTEENNTVDASLIGEMRSSAAEFFVALRLLLDQK